MVAARAAVACFLFPTVVRAFPERINDAGLIACTAGNCPTMHGVAPQLGTALTAIGKADGATYTPGETINLANTGGGQYVLFASANGATVGRSDNAALVVTAPAAGTLVLLSVRAPGRAQCTYQTITLTSAGGGGGGGGGIIGIPPPPPPLGGIGGGIGGGVIGGAGGLDTSPTAVQQAKAAGRILVVGNAPLYWSAMPQQPQQVYTTVGTAVQFKYSAMHDVWSLPDQAAWQTCSMLQGTRLASQLQGGGLPTDATLTNLFEGVASAPGTYYCARSRARSAAAHALSLSPSLPLSLTHTPRDVTALSCLVRASCAVACGVAGHCVQGLKIELIVQGGAGGVGGSLTGYGDCGWGAGPGFLTGWAFAILVILGGRCFVRKCRDAPPPPPPGMTKAAPGGWQPTLDPSSGRTYYYNPTTGEVRWEPP